MTGWLDTAGAFSRSTVFTALDDEANDIGGDLSSNWNAMKGSSGSGINH